MVVTLVHFGITMGRLWSHFGYTKYVFKKHLFTPTDFNDFIKLRGELWSTSGQNLAYECELWVTLASLLTCEIDFGASLGSLWGDFRIRG